jgi:hypothetical protein
MSIKGNYRWGWIIFSRIGIDTRRRGVRGPAAVQEVTFHK